VLDHPGNASVAAICQVNGSISARYVADMLSRTRFQAKPVELICDPRAIESLSNQKIDPVAKILGDVLDHRTFDTEAAVTIVKALSSNGVIGRDNALGDGFLNRLPGRQPLGLAPAEQRMDNGFIIARFFAWRYIALPAYYLPQVSISVRLTGGRSQATGIERLDDSNPI